MTDKVDVNEALSDWLFSLKLMHRSRWDAARWYDRLNLVPGVGAAVCAAIAGTSAFSAEGYKLVTRSFGLIAAILAAVDDESPPVPRRFYERTTRSVRK